MHGGRLADTLLQLSMMLCPCPALAVTLLDLGQHVTLTPVRLTLMSHLYIRSSHMSRDYYPGALYEVIIQGLEVYKNLLSMVRKEQDTPTFVIMGVIGYQL